MDCLKNPIDEDIESATRHHATIAYHRGWRGRKYRTVLMLLAGGDRSNEVLAQFLKHLNKTKWFKNAKSNGLPSRMLCYIELALLFLVSLIIILLPIVAFSQVCIAPAVFERYVSRRETSLSIGLAT